MPMIQIILSHVLFERKWMQASIHKICVLQEEFMLTGIMTLAICNLLATLGQHNPQDYVYAAMFMISTTCFLKIQWLVGTVFMMAPLAVTHYWHKASNILPTDAMVHLVVSWAVGGFMAYLSDTYRR